MKKTDRMTLTVAGRVGPYDLATEAAVRGLAEKLQTPEEHVVALRLADGTIGIGLVDHETVTIDELTPGIFAVRADVEYDDDLGAPTDRLGELDEPEAA